LLNCPSCMLRGCGAIPYNTPMSTGTIRNITNFFMISSSADGFSLKRVFLLNSMISALIGLSISQLHNYSQGSSLSLHPGLHYAAAADIRRILSLLSIPPEPSVFLRPFHGPEIAAIKPGDTRTAKTYATYVIEPVA